MGIKAFFERLFGKGRSSSVETIPGEDEKEAHGNGEGTRLVCMDCKRSFLFESGEQKFFKMRGLTSPKRCPPCRAKRKHRR